MGLASRALNLNGYADFLAINGGMKAEDWEFMIYSFNLEMKLKDRFLIISMNGLSSDVATFFIITASTQRAECWDGTLIHINILFQVFQLRKAEFL